MWHCPNTHEPYTEPTYIYVISYDSTCELHHQFACGFSTFINSESSPHGCIFSTRTVISAGPRSWTLKHQVINIGTAGMGTDGTATYCFHWALLRWKHRATRHRASKPCLDPSLPVLVMYQWLGHDSHCELLTYQRGLRPGWGGPFETQ